MFAHICFQLVQEHADMIMSPSSPYPDVPGLTKRDLDDATSIIKDIKDGTFDIKRLDLMSRFGIDRSALLRHEVTDVPQYLSDNSLDLYLQVVKAAAMLRHEEQVRLYVCASLFRLFVTNLAGMRILFSACTSLHSWLYGWCRNQGFPGCL